MNDIFDQRALDNIPDSVPVVDRREDSPTYGQELGTARLFVDDHGALALSVISLKEEIVPSSFSIGKVDEKRTTD